MQCCSCLWSAYELVSYCPKTSPTVGFVDVSNLWLYWVWQIQWGTRPCVSDWCVCVCALCMCVCIPTFMYLIRAHILPSHSQPLRRDPAHVLNAGRYTESMGLHRRWVPHQLLLLLSCDIRRVFASTADNYVHRLVQNKSDGKLVQVEGQDTISGVSAGHTSNWVDTPILGWTRLSCRVHTHPRLDMPITGWTRPF